MEKERFSRPVSAKLTPSQESYTIVAATWARTLKEPEFMAQIEAAGRQGEEGGTVSAFYRAAIVYYSRMILEQIKVPAGASSLKEMLDMQLGQGQDDGL